MKRQLIYAVRGKSKGKVLMLAGFLVACVGMFSLLTPYLDKSEKSNAATTKQGTSGTRPLYTEDKMIDVNGKQVRMPAIPTANGEKLSASNPFVILEIIPHKGLQELGYHVEDSEPVDLDRMLNEATVNNIADNFISVVTGNTMSPFFHQTPYTKYTNYFSITAPSRYSEEFRQEYIRLIGKEPTKNLDGWRSAWGAKTENGCMVKVEDGTGYYKTSDGVNFSFCDSYDNRGDYIWESMQTEPSDAYNVSQGIANIQLGDKIWKPGFQVRNDTYTRDHLVNNDLLVKELFWLEAKTTLTVDELNGSELSTYNRRLAAGESSEKILQDLFDALPELPNESGDNSGYARRWNILDGWETGYKNTHVQVIAVTPEILKQSVMDDTEDTLDYVERADMIYVNCRNHNTRMPHTYEEYGYDAMYEPFRYTSTGNINADSAFPDFYRMYTQKRGNTYSGVVSNDIPWESAYKIIERLGTEPELAIWFDTTLLQRSYTNSNTSQKVHIRNFVQGICHSSVDSMGNNAGKLFYMSVQMDPSKFYEHFFSDIQSTTITEYWDGENNGSVKKTTGYLNQNKTGGCSHNATETMDRSVNPTNIYWNKYTFWPNARMPDGYPGGYSQFLVDHYGFSSANGAGAEIHTGLNGWTGYNAFAYNGGSYLANKYLTTLHYIRNIKQYSRPSRTVTKQDLNILNIEPSAEKLDSNGEVASLKKEEISKYLNSYNGDVTITTMTTAEFIGMQEDLLSEYDLIYFGAATNGLNRVLEDGKYVTRYNDDSLNGFLYLHVGDRVKNAGGLDEENHPTWLDGLNESRLSGNDINEAKLEALLEYYESDYPIILSDEFYNSEGSLDEEKVDKDSNMAKFMQAAISDEKGNGNVFRESLLNISDQTSDDDVERIDRFIDKVNACRNIARDLSVGYPTMYGNGDENRQSENDNLYIQETNNGHELTFAFTLHEEGKDYKAELYLDGDGNGVFDDEPNVSKNIDQNNKTLSLAVDGLVRTNGSITWKLIVYERVESGAKTNRLVRTGTSARKTNPNDKEVKYVLQVTDEQPYDATIALGHNIWMTPNPASSSATAEPPDPSVTPAPTYKPEAVEAGKKINEYLENTLDYEFVIVSITAKELEDLYDDVTRTYHVWNADVEKGDAKLELRDQVAKPFTKEDPETDRFACFDMIVMGCANAYKASFGGLNEDDELMGNWTESGIVSNLTYAMSKGKPVIFTNDTTSLVNNLSNAMNKETLKTKLNQGYYMNLWYRSILGLDRFGARGSNAAYFTDWSDPDHPVELLHDDDYDETRYGQKHGYSYYGLSKIGFYGPSGTTNAYLPFGTMRKNSLNGGKDVLTKNMEVAYDSTVTRYPYNILEDASIDDSVTGRSYRIDIAPAHAQSYQINPKDPEVRIYATLDGDEKVTGGLDEDKAYASSPHDVTNNYYLYQKKNAIYSGIGNDSGITDMEAKLFVNTLVMAANMYKKESAPEITVRDSVKTIQCLDGVYIDMDAKVNFEPGDNGKHGLKDDDELVIYFKVVGNGLYGDPLDTKVALKGNGRTLTVYGEDDLDGSGLPKDGDGNVRLTSGEWYAVKYKKLWFVEEDHDYRWLTITTKDSAANGGMMTKKEVLVMERFLFNLD